jgi:hypothetical protein
MTGTRSPPKHGMENLGLSSGGIRISWKINTTAGSLGGSPSSNMGGIYGWSIRQPLRHEW